LDVTENRTRKIAYKVIIDNLPGLSLDTETPEETSFDIALKIVDFDISQFVMGDPLNNKTRIV
jgi:hypothetical protein